ncbi:MAG: hypothetical protein FWF33_00560 [Clostridiales bacterium]|nr:hypothetical protein [Clostridiales bacterium]
MLVKEWTLAGAVIFSKIHSAYPTAPRRNRAPKQSPSAAAVLEVNKRNMIRKIQRLICANFGCGDGFITCTSNDEHLPKDNAAARKQIERFLRRLRRWYKRRGLPFKYLYVSEIGESGRHHVHIIINGGPSSGELRELWGYGDINRKDIYDQDGEDSAVLATYLGKEKAIDIRNYQKNKRAFSHSRNLVDPLPVRDTVKNAELDCPTPHPGFYIDKDSIFEGINPFTGRAFKAYTEKPLIVERGAPPARDTFPLIVSTIKAYHRKRKHQPIADGTLRWIRENLKGGAQYEFDIDALLADAEGVAA